MKNFFDTGSPYLNHPLLTEERSAQEVDFLLDQMQLPSGSRILDVGCGFGRHSIELAKRGFEVVGIDPSAAMLASAQQRADQAGVTVEWQQIAAEEFVTDKPFDAAICLFTTLGQVTNEQSNVGLLARVADALVAGGHFWIEVPQREAKLATTKMQERFGAGDRYTDVQRYWNPSNKLFAEQFTLVNPDTTRTYNLVYQLFSVSELEGLLRMTHFSTKQIYARFEVQPLMPQNPMMLFYCQK